MEKLIVRNFGPIKEAEIDLTKYVVFIGDTSTGKSVLGKLISIFRDINFSMSSNPTKEFKNLLIYYNIDFNLDQTEIKYTFDKLKIILKKGNIEYLEGESAVHSGKILNASDEDVNFVDMISKFNKIIKSAKIDLKNKEEGINLVNDLLTTFARTSFLETIYFPAERMLLSIVGSSISGLWANNIAIPNYLKSFSAKFEVARKRIKTFKNEDFGFNYNFESGENKMIYSDYNLFLSQSSSGLQSLVPLLIVLEDLLSSQDYNINKSLLIEEPEINLYPIKQKKLLEHIISKLFNTNHKLTITTHSPYILTVLDTFILAKNTFNEHPDLKEEINAIVPGINWIDYNEISVYEVRNDGKVYSIKNEEFKSIDTNAIDGVSDIISEEFDKLTELRYAH